MGSRGRPSRERPRTERRAVRQERSHPIVAELEPWLRAKLALISKKSQGVTRRRRASVSIASDSPTTRTTTRRCGLFTSEARVSGPDALRTHELAIFDTRLNQ